MTFENHFGLLTSEIINFPEHYKLKYENSKELE